ncbi:hypothetical protein EGT71_14970 [Atlantibacter subterranea]|uniref:Uncharacterized protein n=1 Tax=Atlantibacter subterraneus TaxID=255519 RepID=A0A3R9FQI1_9ENTR|nr:phage tail protein [Atlantibacter subterranea]RSB61541.1 hypothetical protein EGK67_13400 [Atlantibacter subterranea]RSE04658.1 hypothetical protein EGT84_13100 [Atlantibacter subterranea]RSE24475.1 hypothetical protein EGT71_14970 [Atlantibacter subterranea]
MTVETYSWHSQLGAGAIEYSHTVRSAQFGNGYEQVAGKRHQLNNLKSPTRLTAGFFVA